MAELKDLVPNYTAQELEKDYIRFRNAFSSLVKMKKTINENVTPAQIQNEFDSFQKLIDQLPGNLRAFLIHEFKRRGLEMPDDTIGLKKWHNNGKRNIETYNALSKFIRFVVVSLISMLPHFDIDLSKFPKGTAKEIEDIQKKSVQPFHTNDGRIIEVTFPLRVPARWRVESPPASPGHVADVVSPSRFSNRLEEAIPIDDSPPTSPQKKPRRRVQQTFEEPEIELEVRTQLVHAFGHALRQPNVTIAKVQKSLRENVLDNIPVLQQRQQELAQKRADALERRFHREGMPAKNI
eukprot:Pompholyxophrys_punicea_v1_NODE_609_length_1599_cov_7.231218.p1 type:complete len:294 gc:universal NODE_609_length_1599_cov_7.231218:1062-181(-)